MITFTLRTGIAGLALSVAAGCASVADIPAPKGAGKLDAPGAAVPAQRAPDNAGWRRIHAGAGRT